MARGFKRKKKSSDRLDRYTVHNPIQRIQPSDLTIGKKYRVRRLERDDMVRKNLQSGIILNGEYCTILLPTYFAEKFSDEDLSYMNCDRYDLTYFGRHFGRTHIYRLSERVDSFYKFHPSDLTEGCEYPLIKVERVTSFNGDEKLLAHLMVDRKYGKMFLPKRYAHHLTDRNLSEMSGNKYNIAYLGPLGRSFKFELKSRYKQH